MATRKRLSWVKLWRGWYTTESHLDIGGLALLMGPLLMTLANGSPVRGELRAASSRPISDAALARETRFHIDEVKAALAELIEVGTLDRTDDGALRFPEFITWQESQSAERMRRHRDRHSDANSDAPGDALVTTRGQRSEVRGQRSEEEKTPSPTEPGPEVVDLFPGADRPDEPRPAAVLDLYNSLKPKDWSKARMTDGRRKQINTRSKHRDLQTLDAWTTYFTRAFSSKFCRGQCPPAEGRTKPFRADLDWLVKNETNPAKVLEGKFDDTAEEPAVRSGFWGRG